MATMATAFPFNHDPQHDWRQHNAVPASAHYPTQQHPAAAQHFGRLGGMANTAAGSAPGMPGIPAAEHQPSLLGSQDPQQQEDNRRTLDWIAQLLSPATRETALLELSKKREQVPELALVLWHSFGRFAPLTQPGTDMRYRMFADNSNVTGVMTALLQEIISVYPLLNPSQLTAAASNRVCNALALLQCVASHNDTRPLFLNGTLQSIAEFRSTG